MTPDRRPGPLAGAARARPARRRRRRCPGSKSVTNRALVLAALAPGRSLVRRPLRSRDTELMAAGLRALGARRRGHAGRRLAGRRRRRAGRRAAGAVDVGNAGTVARFLPPVAALSRGTVRFDGDPRVRERPLGPLLAALRALGADLDPRRRAARSTVRGTGRVRGGTVVLDASQSSQLVSGLLLAGARFDEGLTVRHEGGPLPSAPHLAMTVEAVRAAGGTVDDTVPGTWTGSPRAAACPATPPSSPTCRRPPPTWPRRSSPAARVTVPDWPTRTTQPGAVLPDLLERDGRPGQPHAAAR